MAKGGRVRSSLLQHRKHLMRQWPEPTAGDIAARLVNPQARREAITSRPWFMSSVGRRTEHAGQTTITLTGMHREFRKARELLLRGLAKGYFGAANSHIETIHVGLMETLRGRFDVGAFFLSLDDSEVLLRLSCERGGV